MYLSSVSMYCTPTYKLTTYTLHGFHSLTHLHMLNLSPAIQFTLTVDSVFRRVGLYSASGIGPFRVEDTLTINNGSEGSCAAPLEFALRVSRQSLYLLDYTFRLKYLTNNRNFELTAVCVVYSIMYF